VRSYDHLGGTWHVDVAPLDQPADAVVEKRSVTQRREAQ
jgi:hypothetical protein